jgi:hypothetical protein
MILLKVSDTDIILAFWSSTSYWTLVHELSHDQPKTMKELLDIATRHTSGEEAVGPSSFRARGTIQNCRQRC